MGIMFNALSRKISVRFSAFERTYVMFALGSAIFTCIALLRSACNFTEMILLPLSQGAFWVSIFFLAGLSSVGALLMLNYSVTHLDIARASIFWNITTVITILAGVLIIHKSFGLYQIIGSVIIIVAAYGVNARRRTEPMHPQMCGKKTQPCEGPGGVKDSRAENFLAAIVSEPINPSRKSPSTSFRFLRPCNGSRLCQASA